MDLYDRVKQQKEIEDAGLEDLEECPFCEWKCEIEASKEQEKLFRCGNEEGGCGVVSCRMCKKEVRPYVRWTVEVMVNILIRIICRRAVKVGCMLLALI